MIGYAPIPSATIHRELAEGWFYIIRIYGGQAVMNREQRRKQAKGMTKEQRRPNSKKNFRIGGYKEIPIDQIQHDPNLKECDPEILELIQHRFDWADQGLIINDLSKCIIIKGCAYLDALCSLRFDITPPDDKAAIRDTMYYVGNYTNLFYGLMADEESEDITLFERSQEHIQNGEKQMMCPMVHELYPTWNLPDKAVVDDLYASFIAEHAQELSSLLQHTRKSDIEGDEEYVFQVLNMILKKTDELLPEAQVNSSKYIIKM